jgi:hypothetical protein
MVKSRGYALSYSMFFGASEAQADLPGFTVSVLAPILRAEDVPLHSHENASFVLVLAGSYMSSADGAPLTCQGPTLIFNPAGTFIVMSLHLARITERTDYNVRATIDGARFNTIHLLAVIVEAAVVLTPQPLSYGVDGLDAYVWHALGTVVRSR